MTNEQLNELLQSFDQKIKDCCNLATLKANDYVRTNDPEDRARSLAYNQNSELWQEAKRLVFAAKRFVPQQQLDTNQRSSK